LEGGTQYCIDDLVKRAENMMPYFGKLGGVTVSGGEPLIQSKALVPFFKKLKEKGIHTNIDTNGSISTPDSLFLIDNYADLIMVDIKQVNEERYKTITGSSNYQKAFELIKHREKTQKPLWLRYVLVPGYTNFEEDLHKLGKTFKDYKMIELVEILPYHKLGVHKWESLGWRYELMEVNENTPEEIDKAKSILSSYFDNVKSK
jgi:pyruvate formate lyase activating enzyme